MNWLRNLFRRKYPFPVANVNQFEVRDGAIIVVVVPQMLSAEIRDRFQQAINDHAKHVRPNISWLVVSGGPMDFRVFNPPAEEVAR